MDRVAVDAAAMEVAKRGARSVIILSCVDSWGRTITVTQDQWATQFLVRHPDLAPHLAAVERTLIAPSQVMYDTVYSDREGFYRPNLLPAPLDHLYVKVCVAFRLAGTGGASAGTVITAYPTPVIKRGEVQKWP